VLTSRFANPEMNSILPTLLVYTPFFQAVLHPLFRDRIDRSVRISGIRFEWSESSESNKFVSGDHKRFGQQIGRVRLRGNVLELN
jgi:hypothetical protein